MNIQCITSTRFNLIAVEKSLQNPSGVSNKKLSKDKLFNFGFNSLRKISKVSSLSNVEKFN